MGASFDVKGNILLIELEGELDHHCADAIREKADLQIDRKDIMHIIFDYEHINFMDSSGIGFVMGRYKKVHDKGGKAVIVGTNAYMDKIFEMSGIYQIITKCKNIEAAYGFIKGER